MSPLQVFAKTLWGEARGQGVLGMEAVAWVIRNRVRADLGGDGKPDWWGEGWIGVCLAPHQFSCWNMDDPNRPLLETVDDSQESFLQALHVASGVMLGLLYDPTNGATHYHTLACPSWAHTWPPTWAAGMKQTAVVGGHAFYRDPAAGPQRSI